MPWAAEADDVVENGQGIRTVPDRRGIVGVLIGMVVDVSTVVFIIEDLDQRHGGIVEDQAIRSLAALDGYPGILKHGPSSIVSTFHPYR